MRLRITFAKTVEMRYTGHLDLHRTWERTFRRANLPLAYTQGYHPQPRIQLACALPLGFTSDCEVADVWLEMQMPLEEIEKALQPALPPGLALKQVEEVDPKIPALQTLVISSEYVITLLDPPNHLDNDLAEMKAASSLPSERRGKTYDLRPLIEEIERLPDDEKGHARIRMRLTAQSGATGRPEEVLSALEIPPESTLVRRTMLYF